MLYGKSKAPRSRRFLIGVLHVRAKKKEQIVYSKLDTKHLSLFDYKYIRCYPV
jgi:hypothetical protein